MLKTQTNHIKFVETRRWRVSFRDKNIRYFRQSALAIVTILFFTGFWSDFVTYLISIAGSTISYPNGTLYIPNNHVDTYLKPINDVRYKDSTRYFFIFEQQRKNGKFAFGDSTYYLDAIKNNSRPTCFYVEILFCPRTNSARQQINPTRIVLDYKSQITPANIIYPLLTPTKTKVYKSNFGNLVAYEDKIAALQQGGTTEDKTYNISGVTSFILKYDVPAPVPGQDVFTIILDGLSINGEKIPPTPIVFDQTRENKVIQH